MGYENRPKRIPKWGDYVSLKNGMKLAPSEHFLAVSYVAGSKVIVLAISVVFGLYAAFVRSSLWAWFLAPFFNLPIITTIQMYILVFIVRSMTYRTPSEEELSQSRADYVGKTWWSFIQHNLSSFVSWSAILIIGWLAKEFLV